MPTPEEILAAYYAQTGGFPQGIPPATQQAIANNWAGYNVNSPTGMGLGSSGGALYSVGSQPYQPYPGQYPMSPAPGYGAPYGASYGGSSTGSTTQDRVARAAQARQEAIARQRAESAARQQRIEQGMDPANARWTPHTYYGGTNRGLGENGGTGRVIGQGRVLENSDIDFAGIAAYQNASPQMQQYLAAQGLAPNISTGQWSSPGSSFAGIRGGTQTGQSFAAPTRPPQQMPQAGQGTNAIQQILNQLMPGGGAPAAPRNLSLTSGRLPGFSGGSPAIQDSLRRNSLIGRGNQAAAAQASQIRQRALAGGESAGMAERRVIENRNVTEQGRRDSIAGNDLAYRADRRADEQLNLNRLGISADLAARLADAYASGGYVF